MLEKVYNLGIPYLVCCRKNLLGEDWFLMVFTEDKPDKKFKVSYFHDCMCDVNLNEEDIYFLRTHRKLFQRHSTDEEVCFYEDRRYNFQALYKEKSNNYQKTKRASYGLMYRPRAAKAA